MKAELLFVRLLEWEGQTMAARNWEHMPIDEVCEIRLGTNGRILVILENGKECIAEREIRILKTP